MKQVFLALAAIVSISSASARIGETLEECKMRYAGFGGSIGFDQFTFRRGSITVIVHIRNGRSIQEDFAPEGGSVLSESDFAELLQENSEGSTWEVSGESAIIITYVRKDGRATAQRAKPNISTANGGNVKLTIAGVELIVKYTASAAASSDRK